MHTVQWVLMKFFIMQAIAQQGEIRLDLSRWANHHFYHCGTRRISTVRLQAEPIRRQTLDKKQKRVQEKTCNPLISLVWTK